MENLIYFELALVKGSTGYILLSCLFLSLHPPPPSILREGLGGQIGGGLNQAKSGASKDQRDNDIRC